MPNTFLIHSDSQGISNFTKYGGHYFWNYIKYLHFFRYEPPISLLLSYESFEQSTAVTSIFSDVWSLQFHSQNGSQKPSLFSWLQWIKTKLSALPVLWIYTLSHLRYLRLAVRQYVFLVRDGQSAALHLLAFCQIRK